MLAGSRGIRESLGKRDWNVLHWASDSPCSSSCSLRASSLPVNVGYVWPNASWIQMEQRRLGRMEKYSQASWECPRVPITQPQEFLSTSLLLYLMGKGSGKFWLWKPGAEIGSQRYLARSLFDSLLLFPAWFPSLLYPLKPLLFLTLDSGSISPSPGYSFRVPGGVQFLDIVGATVTNRSM